MAPSLAWLKPPKVPADGVMSLADHLREFRYRVIISALALIVGMVVSALFQHQLLDLLLLPYRTAMAMLKNSNADLEVTAVLNGVTSPFFLVLQVCMVAGVVITAPVWLYQVWAYIAPALLAKEKKYALGFVSVATPLFLMGVLLGYWILPQGIAVMLAFTPDVIPIANLVDVGDFLKLTIQLMLVFGLGFLIPVVVVALNLMGILPGSVLKKSRSLVIFGSFLFAAMATPGGDPISMVALAIPLMLLFLLAEWICRMNDKRREKRLKAEGLWVEPVADEA